jgi:hypothetical protein
METSSRCLELGDFTIVTRALLHRTCVAKPEFEATIEFSEGTGLLPGSVACGVCIRKVPGPAAWALIQKEVSTGPLRTSSSSPASKSVPSAIAMVTLSARQMS